MESASDRGSWVGDVRYESEIIPNVAFHQLSHPPGTSAANGLYYVHPASAGKDVVVYVMERTMSNLDVSHSTIRTVCFTNRTI